jgi:nucleoside-diphosphate-sugar epimerase
MALWAISGGSGFLGVRLAGRLRERGLSVRTLDLEALDEPGIEALIGDIRRAQDVEALCKGADVLVHAAASMPIRPAEIRSVNVEGTATLLAAAAKASVRRVVFLSSAVVYGLARRLPISEDEPPAPFEAYGRSKLEAEALCAEFGRRSLETVVLRPTAFVGPGRLGVFGILFDWIREGRRVYTLGPGTNRYQLLDVDDLVAAVLLAAEHPVAGRTFNLGASEVGTVAEELAALCAHAGSSSRLTPIPAAPARIALRGLAAARLSPLSEWHYRTADRDFVVDVSSALGELGWVPRFSNVDALTRAYDSFVEHRSEARSGRTHRARWNEGVLGALRRLS